MKKRIITLLAVVALLVVCAVVAAPKAEAATPRSFYQTADWTCPGCGKTGDQVTFYTWGDADYATAGNPGGARYGLYANDAEGECYHYFLTPASESGSQRTITGTGRCVIVVSSETGSAMIHATNPVEDIRFMYVGEGQEVFIIGNNATIKGSMKGGEAGGVFNVGEGGTLHLSGSLTIKGQDAATGVPTAGGLIYNKGTLTMDGVTVDATLNRTANSASGNGGAIANQGTMTISNSTITGGKISSTNSSSSGKMGGAIYNDSTLTINNSTINGTAAYRGGAIYSSGPLTINGGTINGGYASNRGGAFMSSGTTKVKDAIINAYTGTSGGTNQIYRGIMVAGGTCHLYGNTVVNSAGKALADGVACTSGTVTLSGNATVQNAAGTNAKNMWFYKADGTCKLRVATNWTGSASIYIASAATLSNHGGTYETDVLFAGTFDSSLAFTAASGTTTKSVNLFLENEEHENPKLTCYGGNFVTCRANLYENGVATGWYLRPQDAFNAYKNSTATEKYIKLWANFATTNTVDDLYVDFNGRTGSTWTNTDKTMHVFDSTLAVGSEDGNSHTISGGTVAPITQINGKTYVFNNNKVYPVDMKISAVSLRQNAAEAGMYYTASVTAHANAGITAWGVAVTLDAAETALAEHLYTQETDTTKLGKEFNSVLVKGIVKSAEDTERANAPIYAKAYIMVGDTVAMSAAADYSLNTLMQKIIDKGTFQDEVAQMATYGWFNALVVEMTA